MAEREYFPCKHSYLRKCEKLTDQELGRLFRALMKYSATGERQELAGRESIAFDFIADDIDRAEEAYAKKCETNRKNRQGSSTTVHDRQGPSTTVNDRQRTPTKGKEKKEPPPPFVPPSLSPPNPPNPIPPISPLPATPQPPRGGGADGLGFGDELTAAFADWLTYKREKRQEYKPTGLKSLVTQVKKHAAKYGEEAVAGLIRQCMAANWQGIIWDKLEMAEAPAKRAIQARQDFQPTQERIAKSSTRLDEFMAKQKGGGWK